MFVTLNFLRIHNLICLYDDRVTLNHFWKFLQQYFMQRKKIAFVSLYLKDTQLKLDFHKNIDVSTLRLFNVRA